MFRSLLFRLRRAAIVGLTQLALAGAALAQYQSPYIGLGAFVPQPGFALVMTHAQRIAAANVMKEAASASARRTLPAAAVAAPVASAAPPLSPYRPLSATDFKPAGLRNVAEEFAAQVRDPLQRAELIQLCRQILSTIEATPGFRKNNLASAATVLFGVSQQVVSGQEFDEAQSEALMQLINDDLVGSGAVAGWSRAQRTRAYDAMVITGGLIAGIAQNGAETGNKEQVEQARRMAREALSNFGP